MDKIIEILNGLKSGVDFMSAKNLVTGKVLDSIEITSLIASLEETFDIEIGMEYMENENFDSVEAMWDMADEKDCRCLFHTLHKKGCQNCKEMRNLTMSNSF